MNVLDNESEPTIHFIVKADDEWEGRYYLQITVNVADVNEVPMRSDLMLEDISIVGYSMMHVDVSGLWTEEDEIDMDRLSNTGLVANPLIAEVVVNAQNMAVITANDPNGRRSPDP